MDFAKFLRLFRFPALFEKLLSNALRENNFYFNFSCIFY